MSDSSSPFSSPEQIEHEAAAWVLRCDRGLSAHEQDAFSEWLAADPRNGAVLARHRRNWNRLDALAEWRPGYSKHPNPDLLAPPMRARMLRFVSIAGVGLATACLLLWIVRDERPAQLREAKGERTGARVLGTSTPPENEQMLADGSVVELNRNARIAVDYTAAQRLVILERGEAHFTVVKDAARPFIVRAGGVDARAVGTAFNVRLDATVVEVLVTKGAVQLGAHVDGKTASTRVAPAGDVMPILEARQRAVVSRAVNFPAPEIATLTQGEIERVLAWQHRLLHFDSTPLNEIVAEFNRRNVVQLVLMDRDLAALRVSAALRSDNVDGFVRLLEAGFNTRVERRGDTEILLRQAK